MKPRGCVLFQKCFLFFFWERQIEPPIAQERRPKIPANLKHGEGNSWITPASMCESFLQSWLPYEDFFLWTHPRGSISGGSHGFRWEVSRPQGGGSELPRPLTKGAWNSPAHLPRGGGEILRPPQIFRRKFGELDTLLPKSAQNGVLGGFWGVKFPRPHHCLGGGFPQPSTGGDLITTCTYIKPYLYLVDRLETASIVRTCQFPSRGGCVAPTACHGAPRCCAWPCWTCGTRSTSPCWPPSCPPSHACRPGRWWTSWPCWSLWTCPTTTRCLLLPVNCF